MKVWKVFKTQDPKWYLGIVEAPTATQAIPLAKRVFREDAPILEECQPHERPRSMYPSRRVQEH